MKLLAMFLLGLFMLTGFITPSAATDTNCELWDACITRLKTLEKNIPAGLIEKQRNYKKINMLIPQLETESFKEGLRSILTYTAEEEAFLNMATPVANKCNGYRTSMLAGTIGQPGVALSRVDGQEILSHYILTGVQ